MDTVEEMVTVEIQAIVLTDERLVTAITDMDERLVVVIAGSVEEIVSVVIPAIVLTDMFMGTVTVERLVTATDMDTMEEMVTVMIPAIVLQDMVTDVRCATAIVDTEEACLNV
jgi:hypothetical protein